MKIISIEFAPNEAVMAQFFGYVIVGVNADQVERPVVARGDVMIPSVEVTEPVESSMTASLRSISRKRSGIPESIPSCCIIPSRIWWRTEFSRNSFE